MSRYIVQDWPVKRFRTTRELDAVERYDEATDSFVPDDGKESLAFVGRGNGCPYGIYVEVPYYENIVKSGRYQAPGRDGKEWHYETRDGSCSFGESYEGRDRHPNELAGRKAMDRACKRWGCANGRTDDPVDGFPLVNCAWCANDNAGHKADDLKRRRRDARARLAAALEEKERLESRIIDAEGEIEYARKHLKEVE